jgi:hypothetical protein
MDVPKDVSLNPSNQSTNSHVVDEEDDENLDAWLDRVERDAPEYNAIMPKPMLSKITISP